jgi:hypothetical protein
MLSLVNYGFSLHWNMQKFFHLAGATDCQAFAKCSFLGMPNCLQGAFGAGALNTLPD